MTRGYSSHSDMANDSKPVASRDGGETRAGRFRWILAGLGVASMLIRAVKQHRPTRAVGRTHKLAPARAAAHAFRKGHEKRDANVKWIFGSVAILGLSGVCIHFGLAGWFRGVTHLNSASDRGQPGFSNRANRPPQVFPRLQVSAPADYQAFRLREESELNSYGWVNRSSGIVRIPITQAMDLVLREGLPTRASSNVSAPGPSSYQLIEQRTQTR